jgi:MFS family permease
LPANAWSPFRHRAFAVLWSASLVSNIGGWMHDLAAGWLMTTLAPSPATVAMVQTATTLPVFLLALPAGTLADRMDKRQLQIVVQSLMLLIAAVLGVLVLRGVMTSALLIGFTLGMGLCTAMLSPTWQSILPKLVPRDDLQPAVALHAVGMNISRSIGPALAGALIVAFGMAWPFFVNALSFVAVIAALLWWRPQPEAPRTATPIGFGAALLQGLDQARTNRALQNTLLRSALFYVCGAAYWALLPLIARVQFAGGAPYFGIMVGCNGAGAVLGALFLPRLRSRVGLDGVVVAGTLGTALAMTGYALLHVPLLGLVSSLIAGASWLATLSSLNVSAQLAVPDWARARGMALYTSVFYGCLALGSLLWGQVASHNSLTTALLVAVAGVLAGLTFTRSLPLKGRT